MSSPFGTPSQSSTPAASNPFATKTTINPFGQNGGNPSPFGTIPSAKNPFAPTTSTAANVNGAVNPFAAKPTPADASGDNRQSAKNVWERQTNGAPPSFGKFGSQEGGFSKPAGKAKPEAIPASVGGQPGHGDLPRSNDPHAKRIYEQLRKDGIRPPAWPSQPGDPNHKAQMAKFREQYESYRSKVRASLTRAALIDDPSKRKTLKNAINFRGICEDMCPEYEKITRITEHDIPSAEKDPQTTFASTGRMVKKLARSAAGQEAPLPMDVLSVPTLRRTLDYLIDDLLRNDENLPALHGYLWDRTRAIRRDFSFFSSPTIEEAKIQASILEDIARFHVTALHLLCRGGNAPEDFVEHQELEQLGKTLLTLRDVYTDCNQRGSPCENEAEFRAYYIVFHANDPNIFDVVQRQWQKELWFNSDIVQTAVSLAEALQNTSDFHGPLQNAPSLAAFGAHSMYFRIVEDTKISYTMACFAECHFPHLRRSILRNVKRALARPKETAYDVTAADLNKFLRFDTVQEAIEFAELHNLEFKPHQENPADRSLSYVMLNNRAHLPHRRLTHQFSQRFVEDKRGSRSLPEVIHRTILADSSAVQQKKKVSFADEVSLFVNDDAPKAPFSMPPPPQGNPFCVIDQPSTNGSQIAKAPPAPTRRPVNSSLFQPTPAAATPATQRAMPVFGSNNAAHKSTPAVDLVAVKQPSNPFAVALPTGKDVACGENVAAQESPSKTPFGAAGIAQSIQTGLNIPAASTGGNGAPNPFAFTSPAAATSSTAGPSTAPQKSLPAFSGFPPQPEATKPKEPAKSLTPPGSPARSSQSSEAPLLKPQAQPEAVSGSAGMSISAPSGLKSVPKARMSLGGATLSPIPESPAMAPTQVPPEVPPKPAQPKRDHMLDFAKWFVIGDNGLMSEFEHHYLEGLLTPVFLGWHQKEEKKRLREEAARDENTADEFRRRCLSVRYFYKWKTNAREKRLKFLRRSGREQLQNFYRSQQTASRIPQATPRSKLQALAVSGPNREQVLVESLRQIQAKQRRTRHPISSSLETDKSRESAAAIGRHFNLPVPQSGTLSPTRLRSSSVSKEGSKTRALREELLGMGTGRFRRSLPSIASSGASSPESMRRSKVSERWRLKAMGIVQLPDGTAVPESLMNDGRFNYYSRSQRASSVTGGSCRAPPASRIPPPPPPPPFPGTRTEMSPAILEDGTSNKRKRTSEDSLGLTGEKDGLLPINSHKRVMSDAESLVNELRAMREEMEEETLWFRSQNERLQTEISSRGGTPADNSI